jgi:DNA-binding NarL/FixJ family response regulator
VLDVAEGIADEGLRLARETGHEVSSCIHLGHLAMIAAIRGREEECRARATEALSIGLPRRLGAGVSHANLALVQLDLGAGRPAEALERITKSAGGGVGVSHPLLYLYAAADWVEAAARAGETDTAVAVLAGFEAWASRTESVLVAVMLARSRGMLAGDEDAPRHFEDALALLRRSPSILEQARTELLYGEVLRRSRQPSRARAYLRAALDGFERMGADPWAERARSELRAAGESVRNREVGRHQELTPQEARIAQLVAGGASNRDVAARLFLSPRTVEYHLYKVFPKLGISSRTELIRLGADRTDPRVAPPAG